MEKFDIYIKAVQEPVLIVSSRAGAGNISVGNALEEILSAHNKAVRHVQIESMLPPNAVTEDLHRYRFISNQCPALLNLVYRLPIFYKRKLLRERIFKVTNLNAMRDIIASSGAKTVFAVSHRQAFWISLLKTRYRLDFTLLGVLTEFGTNLGWRYIEWGCLDGFISPLPQDTLKLNFNPATGFFLVPPLCRKEFTNLTKIKADKNKVLYVMGYWGQISIAKSIKIISAMLSEFPDINIRAVCGTNERLLCALTQRYRNNVRVAIFPAADSLLPVMSECASIITKPGFSTLIEANAAARKIFLLKGMPVAEDNNARHALRHFNAQWFSIETFRSWYINNS